MISRAGARFVPDLQALDPLRIEPASRGLVEDQLRVAGHGCGGKGRGDHFKTQVLSFADFKSIVVQFAGVTEPAVHNHRKFDVLGARRGIDGLLAFMDLRLRIDQQRQWVRKSLAGDQSKSMSTHGRLIVHMEFQDDVVELLGVFGRCTGLLNDVDLFNRLLYFPDFRLKRAAVEPDTMDAAQILSSNTHLETRSRLPTQREQGVDLRSCILLRGYRVP